mmetsp:Transcript_50264/g.132089  ORF Transcript_50264/g.132089 Transcript_50264/m.132089 type:complete len:220 (+) Transcript_50264:656-1315(+)
MSVSREPLGNMPGLAQQCSRYLPPGSAPASASGSSSGGTTVGSFRPWVAPMGSRVASTASASRSPSSRWLNWSIRRGSWARRDSLTSSPPAQMAGSLVRKAPSTTSRPSSTSDCSLRAAKRVGSTPGVERQRSIAQSTRSSWSSTMADSRPPRTSMSVMASPSTIRTPAARVASRARAQALLSASGCSTLEGDTTRIWLPSTPSSIRRAAAIRTAMVLP